MSQSGGMLGWWPGLASLWRFGRLGGLLTAVAFTLLLNGAVVATFVFPDEVPPQIRYPLWLAVLAGAWWSMRSSPGLVGMPLDQAVVEVNEGLFLQAQAEYLKGHWFEAETPLREILKSDPDDVDARLLLVGLLRHSARYDEARRQLKRLGKMPRAGKWEAELKRELALLPAPSRAAAGAQKVFAASSLRGSPSIEKKAEAHPATENECQGLQHPTSESWIPADREESDGHESGGESHRMRRAA